MGSRAACVILSGAALLVAAADASPPIYVIPTELAPGASAGTGGPVEVELYVQDAVGLAAVLQVTPAPAAGSDRLRYRALQYPQLASARDRSWLESTFVVDHDEPAVRSLYSEWTASADAALTRAGVVAFVSTAVRPALDRGFDVASTVARLRHGDCTEFAVLTAALARRAGLPARVADGVALVHGPDGPAGMGHAWTEILEDGRWIVADAALATLAVPVTYIPYGIMEDEGSGFALSRMQTASLWIRRIVVHGGDPGSHSPARGAELEHP